MLKSKWGGTSGSSVLIIEEGMVDIKFKYGLGVPRIEGKGLSREYKEGNRVHDSDGISPTLPASGGGLSGGSVLIEENMNPNDILKLASVSNTKRKEHIKNKTIPDVESDIADDLCIATRHLGRNGGLTSELSPTIQASETPHITSNFRIRRLTALECERLMGWEDNRTKYGKREDGSVYELANNARYRAIGNGIISQCPEEILKKCLETEFKEKIRVFSTFSGVDGSCHKLDINKYEIQGFSEFDPAQKQQHAANVLRYKYPTIPNFGDITKLKEEDVPDHDLIFISAPCQSFSVAGKQLGLEDTKGTLFYETARIMNIKKPKYAIFENVANLLSINGGEIFIQMMQVYSSLGYEMDFELINGKNFGVAQNRLRVFMFMRLKDDIKYGTHILPKKLDRVTKLKARIYKDHPEINLVNLNIPNNNGLPTPCIKDILEDNVDEKYYLRNEIVEKICKEAKFEERLHSLKTPKFPPETGRDVSYCLDSNYAKGTNTTEKSRRQLVAYSKSTRTEHVDHRARIGSESNTLSTGDGCANMSTATFVKESEDV